VSPLLLAGCHVFGTLDIPCVEGMPCARGGPGDADTDVDADTDADADTDTDTGLVRPEPDCWFDAGQSWPLPTPAHTSEVGRWSVVEGDVTGACQRGGTGTSSHALRDVDGDRRPELLLTQDECLGTEVGATAWYAYPNSGSAIGPARDTLALPDDPFADVDGLWRPPDGREVGTCKDGSYTGLVAWHADDVDGDGVLDLLVLRDDCAAVSQPPTWTAWLGGDGGFGRSLRLTLPSPLMSDPDYWASWGASGSGTCNNGGTGRWAWAPADLDANGVPDLIFTEDGCTGTVTGRSEWRAYLGSDAGWTTSSRWALPDLGYAGDTAYVTALSGETSGRCTEGRDGATAWGLVELTGDRKPDFVVFRDGCRDEAVGEDHWLVYANTGNGFSGTPIEWALPTVAWTLDSAPPLAASDAHLEGRCADGDPATVAWQLGDVSGDAAADLLVTTDGCGWADGRTTWVAYPADPARGGFGDAIVAALPETSLTAAATPFASAPATAYGPCDAGGQGYFSQGLYDLDGDGAVELVYTRDSCAGDSVGHEEWVVHRTVCAD